MKRMLSISLSVIQSFDISLFISLPHIVIGLFGRTLGGDQRGGSPEKEEVEAGNLLQSRGGV